MKVKEKLIFIAIQRLIYNNSFETAIRKIDILIPTTTCIRKCVNLKAQCLIELGNYYDAYEMYRNYFPYAMIDTEDIKAIKILSKIEQHLGNKIQTKKYENSYKILSGTYKEREFFLNEQQKLSYYVYNEFLKNGYYSKEILENIIIDNLQMLRITEATVYLALAKYLSIDIKNDVKEAYNHYTQAQKFKDELLIGNMNKFCVVSEHSDLSSMLRDRCMVKALSEMGELIYHIVPYYESFSVMFSTEKFFELQEQNGNIITIKLPKIDTRVDIGFMSDVIKILHDNNKTNDPIVLFGNSDLLMEMNENVEISKILEMYFRHYETLPIPRMDCLLVGSYFSSISHIWGFDVKKEYIKKPVYDFSIIIPVRDSIKYLGETVETCLNQDFEGAYEILISDNSFEANVNVKEFVNNLKDSRVRYIRTPFDLSLAKSFEFAYFKSRGKYLISIGSDDGLVNIALSTIYDSINKYPDNNVFVWDHAIYNWPEFPCGDQANKVYYNYMNFKDIRTREIETEPLIRQFALNNIPYLYMPNMYLVSCIKREHIDKIIRFTGKFEDGDSQDIYTGMVNLFIEDKITYIDYPLVIAGNSEVSVGLFSTQSLQSMESMGNGFRSAYRYYRYRNYYSQDYRNVTTILGTGSMLLLYREFVKVIRYNTKKDYRNKEDIIRVLHKLYIRLPEKSSDEAFYLKQIENIAKKCGEDVFNLYLFYRNKWNIELKLRNYIKRIIRSKTLRHNLRKMYYRISKLLIMQSKKSNNIEEIYYEKYKNLAEINCNEMNIQGVKNAAESLLDEIG